MIQEGIGVIHVDGNAKEFRETNSMKRGEAERITPLLTFTKLELVEDCRFTGSIETHHQDTHFLLPELSLKEKERGPWLEAR